MQIWEKIQTEKCELGDIRLIMIKWNILKTKIYSCAARERHILNMCGSCQNSQHYTCKLKCFSPSNIVSIQTNQVSQTVRQEDGAYMGLEDLILSAVVQDANSQQRLDHLASGHLKKELKNE